MQEAEGNLWDFWSLSKQHIACITTNGFVKKNGDCVMGKGCAKEARDRFPGFARMLGDAIKLRGNHVTLFPGHRLVSFPTKHVWWNNSDIKLIEESAIDLCELAGQMPDNIFYLPRPGCGNGQLIWKDVKPIIENILPDNVIVITYDQAR